MQKTAQAWFTGGLSSSLPRSSSSVHADWNAYAKSSKPIEPSSESSSTGFDLEAAVQSANDKVSGTFSAIWGSRLRQREDHMKTKALHTWLMVMVVIHGFVMGLKGMLYNGASNLHGLVGKYGCPWLWLILSHVVSLSYYALSYFAGGSVGLKFFSSAITSSILGCFRR